MTLAYCPDALIFDAPRGGYALRGDFDPILHRVDIQFGQDLGFPADEEAGWNDPEDPPPAHVRDMHGAPIHAGHAYVADRFTVRDPDHSVIGIDLIEIDHDPIAYIAETALQPGTFYPLASPMTPCREPEDRGTPTGFAPGTLITTRQGDLPVEWLAAGDEILTLDGAPQRLCWAGYARHSVRDLAQDPALRPVHLSPATFGAADPRLDLWLAPGTQALLSGPDIALTFGLDLALARVGDLVGGDDRRAFATGITYFTLLFEEHQVIRANGTWCASLFADPWTIAQLAQRFARFPQGIHHDRYALPCLSDWEAALIGGERSLRARRPLIVAA